MSAILDKESIIKANAEFAKGYTDCENPCPKPTKRVAILTCMDAWIHPTDALGLAIGESHVIRSAGGSAKEGLRSLIISQQILETQQVIVIKHTRCGMAGATNAGIREIVKKGTQASAEHIDFLPFPELVQAVKDDVEWLRAQDLMPEKIRPNISGWVLHLETGLLQHII